MQYIGDDDKKFTTSTRFDNSTLERARQTKAQMLKEVRERGSAGAFYRALDNEIFSGIKHFDVSDDRRSEQRDIKRNQGFKPTKNDVLTKEIIAPVSERHDKMDEMLPVHGKVFVF